MKTLFTSILSLMVNLSLLAQVPQAINYQAVARDLEGKALKNQEISVRINIIAGNPLIMSNPDFIPKNTVYSETHEVKTNGFGLFNIAIGQGWSDKEFSSIRWNHGTFFLRVEMDPEAGNNYHPMGMSQILSVPYAMYAEKAGSMVKNRDNLVLTSPDNKKWALTVDNEGQLSTKPLRHKKWYRGTVKDYTGLDGCRYIIELDNGKKLEPHAVNSDSAFEFFDGQRVKVQYTKMDNMASICMVGEMVRIDKIVGISAANDCKKVLEDVSLDTLPRDPVNLEQVSLEERCLVLKVRYSGGCKPHRFELVKPAQLEMTYGPVPQQLSLLLSHDANGDMCEAYLSETLKFDVSSILPSDQNTFTFDLHDGNQTKTYHLPLNAQGQQGQLIHYSGCKRFTDNSSSSPRIPPTKSGVFYDYHNGILKLTHVNAGFNCCPAQLSANVMVFGDSIMIKEDELKGLCDCHCLYDLNIIINNLEQKQYTLLFKEPYYHEDNPLIFSVDLRNKPSGHYAADRTGHYPWTLDDGETPGGEPSDNDEYADSLLNKKLTQILNRLPTNWNGNLYNIVPNSARIKGVPAPMTVAEFVNSVDTFEVNVNKRRQHLVLYFYPLSQKDTLNEIIDQSMMYSWCIPMKFKETSDYFIITSPCYHHLKCRDNGNNDECENKFLNDLNVLLEKL